MRESEGKPKQSIVFVLPWSIDSAGGVNEVVRNLIQQAVSDPTYDPILLVPSWPSTRFQLAWMAGYKSAGIRFQSPFPGKHPIRGIFRFLLSVIPDILKWRRFLRDERVHAINVHYPLEQFFILALLRRFLRRNFTLALSVHGADITRFACSRGLRRMVVRFIFESADRIIACSDSLALQTKKVLPTCAAKVVTIHNGIDPEILSASISEAPRRTPVGSGPYIVSVGTYEAKKGQDVLLVALQRLSETGDRIKLVLVGRSTPYLDHLQRLAQDLRIHNDVLFLENLEHGNTLRLIAEANLFVLPSLQEPFGIVLLEAAYLGTPIVASRTGGVPEVLGDGYPFLVEPSDPAAMASAISSLLNDKAAQERLIPEMKRRASEKFSWKSAYEKYIKLLQGPTESV